MPANDADFTYYNDQELPVATFDLSALGEDFSTEWTFSVRLCRLSAPTTTLLLKTTGITSTATTVTVAWSTTDWSGLPAALPPQGTKYVGYLYARRTADSKDLERDPTRAFTLKLMAAAGTTATPGTATPIYAADHISLSDAGGYYDSTDVEGALQTEVARVATANHFTVSGGLKWGPASDTGELEVRSTGDDGRAVWEVNHAGTAGYILHLTSNIAASGITTGASLIGLGVDQGGRGLFVNNKDNGVGIWVTQNDTITDAAAYGVVVSAGSTVAPGMWLGQGIASAAPALVVTANVAPAASQKLMRWVTTVTTASDTEIGHVRADTGLLQWNYAISATGDIGTSGAINAVTDITTTTGTVIGAGLRMQSATPTFQLYQNSGGTSNQRRFHWSISGTSLLLSSRNDAGTSTLTPLTIAHATGNITYADGASFIFGTTTGTKFGTATTQKISFYNATPIVQPSGIGAAATDPATTQTLANNLRTALINLGLVAA